MVLFYQLNFGGERRKMAMLGIAKNMACLRKILLINTCLKALNFISKEDSFCLTWLRKLVNQAIGCT